MKAACRLRAFAPSIDQDALSPVAAHDYVPGAHTMYRGIPQVVAAGDEGGTRYWCVSDAMASVRAGALQPTPSWNRPRPAGSVLQRHCDACCSLAWWRFCRGGTTRRWAGPLQRLRRSGGAFAGCLELPTCCAVKLVRASRWRTVTAAYELFFVTELWPALAMHACAVAAGLGARPGTAQRQPMNVERGARRGHPPGASRRKAGAGRGANRSRSSAAVPALPARRFQLLIRWTGEGFSPRSSCRHGCGVEACAAADMEVVALGWRLPQHLKYTRASTSGSQAAGRYPAEAAGVPPKRGFCRDGTLVGSRCAIGGGAAGSAAAAHQGCLRCGRVRGIWEGGSCRGGRKCTRTCERADVPGVAPALAGGAGAEVPLRCVLRAWWRIRSAWRQGGDLA
ncbi:hypothetical protein FQR65_LT20331 [Abscondita terminalis]|nr:hypothetical protein FQR65_LT20331 [Abscondita terminalis]